MRSVATGHRRRIGHSFHGLCANGTNPTAAGRAFANRQMYSLMQAANIRSNRPQFQRMRARGGGPGLARQWRASRLFLRSAQRERRVTPRDAGTGLLRARQMSSLRARDKRSQTLNDDARQPGQDRGASGLPEREARGVRSLLAIACVFAIVGGYTDAYSYLAHGHVFANAQTGNVVFVGVYASGGEWGQAARHLPPIAAFILGVAVAHLLGVKSQKREFRATLACQSFELAILHRAYRAPGRGCLTNGSCRRFHSSPPFRLHASTRSAHGHSIQR